MEELLLYPLAWLFRGIADLFCLAVAYLHLFLSFRKRVFVRARVRTLYNGSYLLYGQFLLRDCAIWLVLLLFIMFLLLIVYVGVTASTL